MSYHSGGYYKDTHVPMSSLPPTKTRPAWSWGSAICNGIALFLCPLGLLCAIKGLWCSTVSYTDHKAGEYGRSSRKKKWAWCCGIFAWLLGLSLIILGILAATVPAVRNLYSQLLSNIQNQQQNVNQILRG